MKKFIACLLAVALLATLLPVWTVAANDGVFGTFGDGLAWSLDEDGVLTVTGAGSMGGEIPWYAHRNQITAVVIGAGVTDISDYAFARMDVASADIADSVTTIGAGAFYGTDLTTVEISENVTAIGYGAFSNCLGLRQLRVAADNPVYRSEDGLLYQGDTLIRVPAGVKAVTFEGELPTIAVDAFRGVTATVTSLQEPQSSYGGTLTWVRAEQTPVPTLTAKYATAAFEGAIQLNVYFAAENIENATEMGLLTFNSYPEIGTKEDAVDVISGAEASGNQYVAHTNGIPAKNLGDTIYFRIYAKFSDGSYAYSAINNYSPQAYAEGRLSGSDEATVALMRSMLDYGAGAQRYFNYRTDTPMNACLDTAHQYGEEWTPERPATLTLGGTEYRKCIRCGGGKQSRLTDKLTVAAIAVTTGPDQTAYHDYQDFSPKGMVVTATLSDGTTMTVADYAYTLSGNCVTITYGGCATELTLTLLQPALVSVQDAFAAANGTALYVEGLYVGVAEEGASSDKELLLKDVDSDAIIALRNVPYGSFPEYGYEYGDLLRIHATIRLDGTSNTPDKRYLDFSDANGDIRSTIVSVANPVSYDLTEVVKVESWEQMQALFAVGAIEEYTYVELSGPIFMNRYDGSDGVSVSRINKNPAGTGISSIRTDGKRTVSFRDNVMERNLGADWMSLMFDEVPTTGTYPGHAFNGSIVGLYTGANGYYFQLTVLEADWIRRQYDNYEVVTEVAKAFQRQGAQIQYDQTQSRRNINPSPEEASPTNTLYLDCSSYVNAVYFEAFGVNAMPYTLEEQRPSTAAFTTYAQENAGTAVDAIGYWENANYTTDDAISGILTELRSRLQVGDLLVYRHGQTSGSSGHVYIYIGQDTFLHCTGSSYVYDDIPSASYDKATTDEKTTGAVQFISAEDIFVDVTNKRYLFKVTDEDTVYNFSLLRPMARGLTPTDESKKRMAVKGIDMEKTASEVSVCAGQTLTYTVKLTNTGLMDKTVGLEERLGENVKFLTGTAGVGCSGQTLRWNGTIPAGQSVSVSYQVQVTGGKLVQSQTSVSGVELDQITTTVSGYTDAQLANVAALAAQYAQEGRTFSNPVDMANSLYQQALGVTPFEGETALTLLKKVIDNTNDTCKDYPLLVPNLYGGLDIRSGFIYDNQRSRLIRQENLAVGDVIVAEYDGIGELFVYLGDGELVKVSSDNGTCVGLTSSGNIYASSDIFVTLIAYDRFAVLRPSMAV